jgi:hypothetical protein
MITGIGMLGLITGSITSYFRGRRGTTNATCNTFNDSSMVGMR